MSGGIHGFWDREKIIVPKEDEVLKDLDCTSYYPMMCIMLGFRPEHLGEYFSQLYLDVFNERQKFKKGTPENYILKILLNSSYGRVTKFIKK